MTETTHADAAPDHQPKPLTGQRTAVELTRCLFLWQRSVRRQFLSRQTLVAGLLIGLCALIVLAWSRHRDPTTKRFGELMLMPTYVAFLLPILAVCYGASSIGGEREDGTLIYLLIVSVPRPLVYTMKFLASVSLAGCVSLVALAGLCALGGPAGRAAWPVFWPASLVGVMAYTSLFLLLGAVFRHGTVLALVYWFFLEVMLGNMPGVINRVSLAFYIRCLVYDAGQPYRIQPLGPELRTQFHPIPGPIAALVLLSVIAILYLLGVLIFSRKEYRDIS